MKYCKCEKQDGLRIAQDCPSCDGVVTAWHPHHGAKVVRHRGEGGGFKIKYLDGSLSPETYGFRKGAERMIHGSFGTAGGIS